jgi:hypothetical protein
MVNVIFLVFTVSICSILGIYGLKMISKIFNNKQEDLIDA